MVQVQVNTGLSNNKMFKLAPILNSISGKKLVETNFREKFRKLTEEYLDDFEITSMMCDLEKSTKSLKTIVHCKSVREVYDKMLS